MLNASKSAPQRGVILEKEERGGTEEEEEEEWDDREGGLLHCFGFGFGFL